MSKPEQWGSEIRPIKIRNQVVIAQWLAQRLATGAVLGSSPGKGDNTICGEKIIIIIIIIITTFTGYIC